MRAGIFEKVREIISKNNYIPEEQVTMDSSFEDLGMDSLDGLTVINDLENAYNITLPNETAIKIKTVREAVETLKGMLAIP